MPKYLRSSRTFLVSAVLLAVLGSLMLYGYLHGLEVRTALNGELLSVPVARVPIPAGTVITGEMLEPVDFPSLYVLPTMLLDAGRAAGTIALHDMAAGDPILAASVSDAGQGGRAALMLEEGRRAYPLALDENQVPLSDLRSGDRVDLLFVPPEGRALVILHAVPVLCLPAAAGDQAEALLEDAPGFEFSSPGHLLLSLTPDETETLAQAEEQGRVIITVCPAAQ